MITILSIGKIKEKSMQEVIAEYRKRLKGTCELREVELANAPNKDTDVVGIVSNESTRILEKIGEKDYLILLDLKGKNIDSVELATHMETVIDSNKNIIFVIGGSHGVSEGVRNRADFVWQLSKLTFPHQFVRMMLMEQIYRSFMIMKNHPYHK